MQTFRTPMLLSLALLILSAAASGSVVADPSVPALLPPGPSVFRLPQLVAWPADAAPRAPDGSGTNVNEEGVEPPDRAAIWELSADGSGKRLFATGLRNPVGMAFEPVTGVLWATVNERDGPGQHVPPDYLTRVVDGAFYGWPYVYFGTYVDPIQQKLNPAAVQDAQRRSRVPLGLHFYRGYRFSEGFPERYRGGAFIARRGGGSRKEFLGFDVLFVPFKVGVPSGAPEAFLDGFIADNATARVYGRPVGLAELPDGSLLVADDAGNTLWRVAYGAE